MKRQIAARAVLGPIAIVLSFGAYSRAHAAIIYASNFNSNTITAYDFATGALLGTPVTAGPETNGLNGFRVNPDGTFLVTGQLTNDVARYSSTGALLGVFDPANTAGLDSPQGVTAGPDGKIYVVSSANDKILKYDPTTGNFLGTFASLGAMGHIGPIDLVFGPDGNLYVTSFDNDQIIKIDAHTGAILGVKQGPAGMGFAAAAFGPDGNFYTEGVDLNTFAGTIYRYNIATGALSVLIPPGSGGLQAPGGLAFGSDGNLLLANLIIDQNFNDLGSTILKYNGQTGAPLGTVVGAGKGLNVPFFIAVVPVPEPASAVLFGLGGICIGLWKRPSKARSNARRHSQA